MQCEDPHAHWLNIMSLAFRCQTITKCKIIHSCKVNEDSIHLLSITDRMDTKTQKMHCNANQNALSSQCAIQSKKLQTKIHITI